MTRSLGLSTIVAVSLLALGCSAANGEDTQAFGNDPGRASRPPAKTSRGITAGKGSPPQCVECIEYGGGAGCVDRCSYSQACSNAVTGGCGPGAQTSKQQCLDACNPCGGACGTGSYDSGSYTACTCDPSDPCGWSNDGYCDSQCATKFGSMFEDSNDCGGSSGKSDSPGTTPSTLSCGADCGNGSPTSGAYTPCTCDPSDPCGWSNDGTCDSQCQTKFGSMFEDSKDCGESSGSGGSSGTGGSSGSDGPTLSCGADCGDGSPTSGSYTSCTCDASDPCGWSNDGYCDSQCQTKFGSMFDDSKDCGGSSGGDTYDPVLGNSLANAAKAGSAGYSMSACYAYVWKALRSVLGWEIESLPIPSTSAYQFGEWVINNPTTARTKLHLVRTHVPAASAPRGSVIVWPRGVCGYSSAHGHIEISLGNGTACSDFCGGIAGCTAQVFMPVK